MTQWFLAAALQSAAPSGGWGSNTEDKFRILRDVTIIGTLTSAVKGCSWCCPPSCWPHLNINLFNPLGSLVAAVSQLAHKEDNEFFNCRHSSATQASVIVSSFDSLFDCVSQRGAAPSKPSGEKRLCYRHR